MTTINPKLAAAIAAIAIASPAAAQAATSHGAGAHRHYAAAQSDRRYNRGDPDSRFATQRTHEANGRMIPDNGSWR